MIRDRIARLWCQHCKALQKANDFAYLLALAEKAEEKDSYEVTVVDMNAELPKFSFSVEEPGMRFGYQLCQQEMLKAGWRKVVNDGTVAE